MSELALSAPFSLTLKETILSEQGLQFNKSTLRKKYNLNSLIFQNHISLKQIKF